MADGRPSHALRWLVIKLVVTAAFAGVVYAFFVYINHRLVTPLSEPVVLLLEAVAVVVLAYAIARSITTALTSVMAERGILARGHAIRLFVNILIATVAILALASLSGISPEAILLGSAFAGIVLGLAAQTVLGNVFAGVLLVFADPFRPGDRVAFVSSSFPALAPSYPHELQYPTYSGVIEDVGLVYTVLRLDSGALARLPNQIVISSMVLEPRGAAINTHRVRMTFPLATDIASVEGALPAIVEAFPRSSPFDPPPKFEVADISATTWDGVFSVSSPGRDDAEVRNAVLRLVLPRIAAATAKPPPAGTA